jgi:hypothetical protein
MYLDWNLLQSAVEFDDTESKAANSEMDDSTMGRQDKEMESFENNESLDCKTLT